MAINPNKGADHEFDDFLNELGQSGNPVSETPQRKKQNANVLSNQDFHNNNNSDNLLFDLTQNGQPQQSYNPIQTGFDYDFQNTSNNQLQPQNQQNIQLHQQSPYSAQDNTIVRQDSDFIFDDLFSQTRIGQQFSPAQPAVQDPTLSSTPITNTAQTQPKEAKEEEHQIDSDYPVKNIKPGPYFELLSSRGKLSLFDYMQKGAVFWKAGKYGLPHFLFFRLDSSKKFIQWFSRNKTLPNTRVSISAVRSLKIGNNPFFVKHCNDRLLKRSLSLQLQEHPSSSPIYFNSAATPKSYYEKDLITISEMSNKTTDQKSFFQPATNTNKNSIESLDIVCLNSVNFLVWGRAISLLVNFNNKLSAKQNKKFWDVTGYLREIEDVEVHLNLPQELIDKSYLLHRFEFFAAVHYNKKYKVEKAKLTAIEQFTIDEIYQQADQINSGIKKIYKKLKSKKITPKEKEEVKDRLDTLAADYKVVKENYLAFGFSRTRKIYWLMYAELIAMNEAVIAITSTAGNRNSYKMI